MSEIKLKKQTVQYEDFKVNFIKIQNKKDIERKISRTMEDVSFIIASLLFEMPTKNTLVKLVYIPIYLRDSDTYYFLKLAMDQ